MKKLWASIKKFLFDPVDGAVPEYKVLEAYQIYGGPRDGEWTTEENINGYFLGKDIYSGRRYYVWKEDL